MSGSFIFDPNVTWDADGANYPHTPGQRARDDKGFEFIFVRAQAHITTHHVAVIYENADARLALASNADKGDRLGISLVDIPANHYGWLCIYGNGSINVAASCAANVVLYTTSVAGRIDDTATGQEQMHYIYLTTARGGTAGRAAATWTYPITI